LAAKRKNPEVIVVEKKVIITQKVPGEIVEKRTEPAHQLPPEVSDIGYFIGFRLGRDIYMHDHIA
jgi:hypothetical protein